MASSNIPTHEVTTNINFGGDSRHLHHFNRVCKSSVTGTKFTKTLKFIITTLLIKKICILNIIDLLYTHKGIFVEE